MTHSTSIQASTNPDGSTSPSADIYHPTYIVYEGDRPTRAVLFNFISDTSGASTARVALTFNGINAPTQAYVRYLSANDISEQYNITWAGQTMGASFASDGTLKGQQSTTNVTCSTEAGCIITVPAPSIAVVFFDSAALYVAGTTGGNGTGAEAATATFGTTIIGSGSATFDPKVLETSNGQNSNQIGKTNKPGSSSAATSLSVMGREAAVVAGLAVVLSLIL